MEAHAIPNATEETDVGIRDIADSGGFDLRTGVLRPGFSVSPSDVVLDVGCGDGIEGLFCARMGAHVISVDVDPAQLEAAARRMAEAGIQEFTPIASDTNPLPLRDGVASKVIAAEVIEHVDDPGQFLRELVRVGRPGAQYFLSVPDPFAEELQRGLAAKAHFEKPNHIRVVGREEFGRMVEDAGLVIERRGYYGFYNSIWWLFFWICKVDLFSADHPLLNSWAKTWGLLLDTPGSEGVRRELNELLPKSQYIVARKPGGSGRGLSPRSLAPTSAGAARRGMFDAIRNFFAPARHDNAALATEVSSEAAPPTKPWIVDDPIDSLVVGLHDAVESGWFKHDRKELFDGFPILPEDVVLDVGCGDGNYSTVCGQWGAHVIFADIDPENVATTQRRLAETPARGMTPIVGDADPLPIEPGTATKIISTEVIEHVDDPTRFLKELVRVGRSGARYLLAVPDPVQENIQRKLAPAAFFVKPKPGEGTIRGLSSGHLRTIGRDEFERMVTDAGLIVEQHRYAGFFWALWFTFFWVCNTDFSDRAHPLLASWARTWKTVLDMPGGHHVKTRLDAFMPKSQIILARKP